MSTLVAHDYQSRLEDRIEDKAKTWVKAISGFENADVHTMDEDIPLRSQTDPKNPVIIVNAQDSGRVRITPWRNISLSFEIHADAKSTKAADFNIFCARLERQLRGVNLMAELNDPSAGFIIGLAVNQEPTKPSNNGLLRKFIYTINLKAVAVEHTN